MPPQLDSSTLMQLQQLYEQNRQGLPTATPEWRYDPGAVPPPSPRMEDPTFYRHRLSAEPTFFERLAADVPQSWDTFSRMTDWLGPVIGAGGMMSKGRALSTYGPQMMEALKRKTAAPKISRQDEAVYDVFRMPDDSPLRQMYGTRSLPEPLREVMTGRRGREPERQRMTSEHAPLPPTSRVDAVEPVQDIAQYVPQLYVQNRQTSESRFVEPWSSDQPRAGFAVGQPQVDTGYGTGTPGTSQIFVVESPFPRPSTGMNEYLVIRAMNSPYLHNPYGVILSSHASPGEALAAGRFEAHRNARATEERGQVMRGEQSRRQRGSITEKPHPKGSGLEAGHSLYSGPTKRGY